MHANAHSCSAAECPEPSISRISFWNEITFLSEPPSGIEGQRVRKDACFAMQAVRRHADNSVGREVAAVDPSASRQDTRFKTWDWCIETERLAEYCVEIW